MKASSVLIARTRHKPRAPFQPKRLDAAHVARSRAEASVAAAEEARYDNEQRLELKSRFAPTKERRVIAMALYGVDPKYVEGCIENARLVEAYFPTWRLRVYARDQSTVPSEKLRELEALKAEIHLDDWSAEGASRTACSGASSWPTT